MPAKKKMSNADARKNYEAQRKEEERIKKEGVKPTQLITVEDTEIFVAMTKLMLREGSDPLTESKGFVQKNQRVSVRKRFTLPTVPPEERLQVATPNEPVVLGWINAEKNGEPTLVPEAPPAPAEGDPPTDPASSEAGEPAAAAMMGSFKKSAASAATSFKKAADGLTSFWARSTAGKSAAVLKRVFFSTGRVDKSDAALEARFRAVDVDGSGAISADEMRAYIAKLFGAGVDPAMINGIMQAADTDGNGEVDLDEFKAFMRAMPDSTKKGPAKADAKADAAARGRPSRGGIKESQGSVLV